MRYLFSASKIAAFFKRDVYKRQQLIVMNRYYDAKYQSVYARSIGEGSTVQNESGFYIGLETSILKGMSDKDTSCNIYTCRMGIHTTLTRCIGTVSYTHLDVYKRQA